MHYVICYDIEDDKKRAKAAKILMRHGCERVQRSVFVAAAMEKKHLVRLQSDLQRLLLKTATPTSSDSLLIIPLRDEHVPDIQTIGLNNILTALEEKPLKIII